MEKLNLKDYEEKILAFERKKNSKKPVRIFSLTLGHLLFIFGLITTVYTFFPVILGEKNAASLKSIDFFSDISNIFYELAFSLGLPDWTAYIFLILSSIIIPIVLVLIFNCFSVFLVKKENSKLIKKTDLSSDIKNTENLIERIEKNFYFESDIEKRFSLTGLFIYFAATAFVLYFISKSIKSISLEENITASLFIAAMSSVLFLLIRLIYFALVRKIWEYWHSSNEFKTKKELEDYLSKLKSEKKRIEKEAKEKREKEQAKKEKEQKRQNQIKSQELYLEATKTDEIEENLMKKAADLEHPEACLYFGKKLMEDFSSDNFTKKEKDVIIKKAKKYLYSARNLNTEAKFLYINASIMTESKDLDEWKYTLKELREIEASGTLPENYADACSTAIRIVVDTIDKLDEKIEQKKNYTPKIKRSYCKFFNAGICNRESGATIVYHCNYHNNPAACSTARTYDGIVYEFE
ncbi:MAG: hypothetical protein J6C29_07400 [Clostridia bacterium]|nr:hypothetical protein [Clostridia bacterium]